MGIYGVGDLMKRIGMSLLLALSVRASYRLRKRHIHRSAPGLVNKQLNSIVYWLGCSSFQLLQYVYIIDAMCKDSTYSYLHFESICYILAGYPNREGLPDDLDNPSIASHYSNLE